MESLLQFLFFFGWGVGGGATQKLLGSSDICKSKKLEGLEVNDILVFNEAMWGK